MMARSFEKSKPRRVVFLSAILTHYRTSFHNHVRDLLAEEDVEYVLAYGQPHSSQSSKGDTIGVPWGIEIHNTYLNVGNSYMVWQPALRLLLGADFAIIGQENRHLLNYLLQSMPRGLRPPLAFFGHGRNFQASNSHSGLERWKRFWAIRVDWWFGYTEETKRFITGLGFPIERVTVFQNAIDTSELSALAQSVTAEDCARARIELGLRGEAVGVYVGGLYTEKRTAFLIEALDLIRKRVPHFEFIVGGGGPDLPLMQAAAESRPWLKIMGPKFGKEKVILMALADVFLVPGLVGLGILDAGVMGLPVITTDYPYHSPEIAYLRDGQNGIISRPWTDASAYSDAVVDLLTGDAAKLRDMRNAARSTAMTYTIEAMAERFAEGVLKALGANRL